MPEVLIDPEESATATAVYADWSDLVARIRSGQDDGMEELYQLFSRGIRSYLARQLGLGELDDRVHDTFLIVVQAIRRDELGDPERLMGFVRTVVRQQVAAHVDRVARSKDLPQSAMSSDLRRAPEEAVAFQRRTEVIDQVLEALSQRDREILTRFYVQEQSQDQICKELALTEIQFRLLKSRAKARFGELGRKFLSHRKQSHPNEIAPTQRADAAEINTGTSPALDVERILPVVAHAVAVFGDEKKASHWLATPLPVLGDRSPSQLLRGQEGIELVEQVLTRIEHNIPS
jgi:RNA polymerase sigma-70 factor (ECF subfamily)